MASVRKQPSPFFRVQSCDFHYQALRSSHTFFTIDILKNRHLGFHSAQPFLSIYLAFAANCVVCQIPLWVWERSQMGEQTVLTWGIFTTQILFCFINVCLLWIFCTKRCLSIHLEFNNDNKSFWYWLLTTGTLLGSSDIHHLNASKFLPCL